MKNMLFPLLAVLIFSLMVNVSMATDPIDGRWWGHGTGEKYIIFTVETVDSVTTVSSGPIDVMCDFGGVANFQYYAFSATNDSVVLRIDIEGSHWNVDSTYIDLYQSDTLYAESTPTELSVDVDSLNYNYVRVTVNGLDDGTSYNPTDAIISCAVSFLLKENYNIDFVPEADAKKEDDNIPNVFSGDNRD